MHNNTENNDNFKSFKYKAKLLGNRVADGANEILKNAAIAVSLKYLSSFWRSLEMQLINCWVKLKVKCIIIYKYFKINMIEEASLEFRLSKKDERANYLLDEIKQNI